jgi:hypothetical protein
MRRRVFLIAAIAFVGSTSAVAFAETRHHGTQCRGSYTYGDGVAHCGPPSPPCAMSPVWSFHAGGAIDDCIHR